MNESTNIIDIFTISIKLNGNIFDNMIIEHVNNANIF